MSSLTATQAIEKPATIDDARRIIETLSSAARLSGYMLALYGSTLTHGRGRNIDILAVPWRHNASPDPLMALVEAHGFVKVGGKPYLGLMRTYSQQFVEKLTGLVLDLQVREVEQPGLV